MVDKRRGKVPDGQTSRGWPTQTAPNPKNNSERRPDVIGKVPNEGGGTNMGTTRIQTSDAFPSTTVPNRFPRGGSEPDVTRNRGYNEIENNGVPTPTDTGANRQTFGIDPADAPQPDGDTRQGPSVPKFGTGDQS
jgi:hypothetical protein